MQTPTPPSSRITLQITATDRQIARLATAAIGLSLLDASIPTPLPGIKPGLANIITLLVLSRFGWITAAWVTGLRILAVSLVLGQFLTPGFFLALAGGVTSLLTLGIAKHLPERYFGFVSWSVLAALAHIAGQIALARLWLIPHDGIYHLIPLFGLAALITGTFNGLIAQRLYTGMKTHHA